MDDTTQSELLRLRASSESAQRSPVSASGLSPHSLVGSSGFLGAEWIHFTLFGDNITHYKTESVYCLGAYELSNSGFAAGQPMVSAGGHPCLRA